MRAITTRYFGPGNRRGSCCVAREPSGHSIRVEWDDTLGTEANHEAALRKLVGKLGWEGQWASGTLAKDGGLVWVNVDDRPLPHGNVVKVARRLNQYECQNCSAVWELGRLNPIQRIFERVAPGEPMPAGECPDCGALCHARGKA